MTRSIPIGRVALSTAILVAALPAFAQSSGPQPPPVASITPSPKESNDQSWILDQLIYWLPDGVKRRLSIFVPGGASTSDKSLENK